MSNKLTLPERAKALVGFTDLPDIAEVEWEVVEALFGLSRATIRRHYVAGLLPAPVRIVGACRWRVSDLRQALQR